MKNKTGITLIALIITIIVMLILVGVTINFALNGGIISKSKQAAAAMQKAADLEELQLAVISAMDYTTGQVVRDDLVSSLSNGWQVTQSAPYTCTSPSGNVFTVTSDGQITAEGESSGGGNTTDEDLAYLRTYIGQNLEDIVNDFSDFIFTDSNITIDSSFDGSPASDGNGGFVMPIRYKGKLYGMVIDGSSLNVTNIINNYTYSSSGNSSSDSSSSDSSSSVEPLEVEPGDYVSYRNVRWIVLYNDQTHGLQLISANTYEVGNVYLGYNDSQIDWTDANVISSANIFNDTESGQNVLSNVEKAMYSYNNLITSLNTKCEEVVEDLIGTSSIVLDVRSVGSNPINKNTVNTNRYTSSYLQSIPKNNVTYLAGAFDGILRDMYNDNEDIGILYNEIHQTRVENNEAYWLAACNVQEIYSESVVFNCLYCGRYGNIGERSRIFGVYESSTAADSKNYGVRPVIILSSSALDNVTGLGTSDNPYVISD